jgi:hypothetical protein
MKLNDKHFDKHLGWGVISKIDEQGYEVTYYKSTHRYPHINIERKVAIIASIVTVLFWIVVFSAFYYVW